MWYCSAVQSFSTITGEELEPCLAMGWFMQLIDSCHCIGLGPALGHLFPQETRGMVIVWPTALSDYRPELSSAMESLYADLEAQRLFDLRLIKHSSWYLWL